MVSSKFASLTLSRCLALWRLPTLSWLHLPEKFFFFHQVFITKVWVSLGRNFFISFRCLLSFIARENYLIAWISFCLLAVIYRGRFLCLGRIVLKPLSRWVPQSLQLQQVSSLHSFTKFHSQVLVQSHLMIISSSVQNQIESLNTPELCCSISALVSFVSPCLNNFFLILKLIAWHFLSHSFLHNLLK